MGETNVEVEVVLRLHHPPGSPREVKHRTYLRVTQVPRVQPGLTIGVHVMPSDRSWIAFDFGEPLGSPPTSAAKMALIIGAFFLVMGRSWLAVSTAV